MGVRNCEELGRNLQKIMNRLLANQNLLKLLYYTDKDPLSHEDFKKEEIRENQIGMNIILLLIFLKLNH